jgi:hypothetical protein
MTWKWKFWEPDYDQDEALVRKALTSLRSIGPSPLLDIYKAQEEAFQAGIHYRREQLSKNRTIVVDTVMSRERIDRIGFELTRCTGEDAQKFYAPELLREVERLRNSLRGESYYAIRLRKCEIELQKYKILTKELEHILKSVNLVWEPSPTSRAVNFD